MTTVTGPPRSSGAIAPGSVVVVRDEEWLVTSAEETGDGLLVRVQGLTELVRDTTATFYGTLDTIEVLDPAAAVVVADTSPRHRTSRLWLEATVRKTPVPLYAPSLTVSTEGLADALSYQQSAVRKALDPENLRPRILLADAVGLGKTLEIGMILSELVRRGRGERILVVTPRHVLEQMQHELWSRFALPFVRLDSTGIQRVRQKLPTTRNPFTFYKRVIISIDTLKSDKYLHSLAKQRWDAVVIDESHNITNTATQNNRLARILANTTEALILASATPHNGKRESFAELVRLLEPSAVTPSGEIEKAELERLVVRRHRHSPEVASVVGADWAERQEPHFISALANAQEDAVANELVATWLHPRDGAAPTASKSAALLPWTLAKAYLSSPAALAQTISERLKRVPDDASGDAERAALTRLADLTSSVHGSAKYDALLEQLREVGVGPSSSERVVVFAERVATLTWLAARLQRDLGLAADAVAVMHGGLTDEEQQRTVDRFKQASSPLRVLVTGDVASEGVNLHAQCHELVHYDIPWSLIRIEQRNGRIDRYGQRKPPRITTLLLIPSDAQFAGDVRVLKRLMDKEHEAHSALGDVASLMGQYSVDSEEQLLRQVLAGKTSLDDVVRSPAQVAEGDDLEALLLSLGASSSEEESAATAAVVTGPLHTTGLFADEVSYLEEALRSAYHEAGPAAPVEKKGVAWDRQEGHGTAQLVPPPDLRQRLEVLPQSYLSERGVTQKLVLASTRTRGKTELHAALADATSSSWPEAHYLSPLHPVLDWAADRALAALGRNEVFAVRGPVDSPQVLLLGTLTNRRGHVVAASWLTVAFPRGTPEFALPVQHETVADALEHLGVGGSRANPGAVPGLEALTALIAPAVRSARGSMGAAFAAAEADVTQRVNAWTARLTDWQEQAALLPRSEVLRERRVPVEREQELVASMRPDRQLVRPLLVVVPG